MGTLTVPALTEELPAVNDFILQAAQSCQCPPAIQMQLELALEELFVNVCHYAYQLCAPDHQGEVRISWNYGGTPSGFAIEIEDWGQPFDPLAKPDPDLTQDPVDRPIGGLGIFLVKSYADELTYERRDDANILRFVKHW